MDSKAVMVLNISKMETNTKDCIVWVNSMERGHISGRMVHNILANLKME